MNGWDHVEHMSLLEKRLAATHLGISPADVQGPITGLIVGEMPGKNTSSKLALFPYPKNSSGGRLMAMSGVPRAMYLGRVLRQNLFLEYGDWDWRQAGRNARAIMRQQPAYRRVVLLGAGVGRAFGFDTFFDIGEDEGGTFYTCIPHPSGRNTIYNDPIARVGARMALQWAADYMVPPEEKKNAD